MMSIKRILRFAKGIESAQRQGSDYDELYFGLQDIIEMLEEMPQTSVGNSFAPFQRPRSQEPRPKRKLSAWNKFVKANSKKPRFKYKSGANKGKLNLKAMAVAFRRTPAGKKSKK
jgi:hypothetical protein